MSDQPQPVREPPPAEIVEEPIPRPYPDDEWDGEDEDDDTPAATWPPQRKWDGKGWPTPAMWWPAPSVPPSEIAVEFNGGISIGLGCLIEGGECAEVDIPALMRNLGPKASVSPVDALAAKLIFLSEGVGPVLAPRSRSQVGDAVVPGIAVDVVDNTRHRLAMVEQPCQPMCQVKTVDDGDAEIAEVAVVSSGSADVFSVPRTLSPKAAEHLQRPRQPSELAAVRVIVQQLPNQVARGQCFANHV
jgi:hypothetical protein